MMKTNATKHIPWGLILGVLFLVVGLCVDYEWLLNMRIMQVKPGFLMFVTLFANTLPGVAQLVFAWYTPKHPRKPGDWEVGIPTVGTLIIVVGFLNIMLWVLGQR